jgi:hypothetical protein
MITDREVIKIIPLKKIRDIFFEKHPHVIKNLNLEEIDIEFKKQKYDPETATPIRLHKLNGEWCIQSGWKLVLGLIRNAGRHQKVKVIEKIVNHQFKFVSKIIAEGEFDSIRLPYFGNFHVNKNRLKHIKEKNGAINNK